MRVFQQALEDGRQRFYRNLVYIEEPNYSELLLDYLRVFSRSTPTRLWLTLITPGARGAGPY